MEGAEQLETLLESLCSEALFDSDGHFTVAWQQSVEKIRNLSEQEAERWMLFVVQAAVGWQAASVDLSIRPKGCAVELRWAQDGPGLKLAPSLLWAGEGACQANRDFQQGLMWLRALQPMRAKLLYQDPRGGWLLDLGHDPPVQAALPGTTRACLQLSVSFRPSSWWQSSVLSRQVSSRLSFCPLPLLQEGRPINSGTFAELEAGGQMAYRYILPEAGERSWLAALHPRSRPALSYRVGEAVWERKRCGNPMPVVERLEMGGPWSARCQLSLSGQPEGMVLAHWHHQEQDQYLCNTSHPLRQLPSGMEDLLGCRAYFQRSREQRSTFWVVQRGCRLHGIDMTDVPMGWWVALAADSLHTDLSASQLVEDDRLSRCVDWARAQILQVHQRMSARRASISASGA